MKVYICFIVFIIGLYFCLNYTHHDLVESFENYDVSKADPSIPDICPNLLVQKGSEYHLVNTKKAMIPGVNPIKFKDLGEYIEYAKWQEKMQNECPVLYFQQTFDTQGKRAFRLLNDPLENRGGVRSELLHTSNLNDEVVDASHDHNPFNKKSYSGFDEKNQQIGERTSLDKKFEVDGLWNPMQNNWAGVDTSESQAAVFKEDRTRSAKELESNMHHKNNIDRLDTELNHLKAYNSRKASKTSEQEFITADQKKNALIKASLKK